jgi:O-antigen/teichoic acid export membrane protein
MREMVSFGGYATFMNIGNRLFVSSTNLVAGITSGAIGASALYSSQMPATTAYNMLYRLTESSTPAIHEIYGKREMQRLGHTFVRLLRLMLMMTFPLGVGIVLFNKDVVTCWVGPSLYAGSLMSNSLAMYVAVSAIQGIAIVFCFAIGWVRLLALSSLLVGVSNFGLGLLLGHFLGLGGITLSLAIVMLPQVAVLLYKLNRTLEINSAAIIGRLWLRSILPLGLASALALYVHHQMIIARHHYTGLILESLTFCVVYSVAAYSLIMNAQDRVDFRHYLSRMVISGRKLHSKIFGSA